MVGERRRRLVIEGGHLDVGDDSGHEPEQSVRLSRRYLDGKLPANASFCVMLREVREDAGLTPAEAVNVIGGSDA